MRTTSQSFGLVNMRGNYNLKRLTEICNLKRLSRKKLISVFHFFLIEQFNVKYDLIRQCSLEKDGVLLINVKIGKI